MKIKNTLCKSTKPLLLVGLLLLLLGSLYSIYFVYTIDHALLNTLKVNNKENEIHKNLQHEFSQIYSSVQHVLEAKNSTKDNIHLGLIDKSIAKIKASREVCIHRGTVLEVDDLHHSFKDQGEQLVSFFKLKEKAVAYKLLGKNSEASALNEELKVAGLKLINTTLKNGNFIVAEENKLKLNQLSDNNLKKLKLGAFICVLFFIVGGYFLFLFLRKHKKHNETLENIALKDNLTGVLNRSSFVDSVNQYSLKPQDKGFMIVFLDIDNFKSINTKQGHHVGNEVLVDFAKKLSNFFIKSIDMDVNLARFGGDEFVLLIKNIDYQQGNDILSSLSKYLNYHFISPTVKLRLSASIGSSHYPTDGRNVDTLLRKADEAMFFAKRVGKNTFKEYEDEMDKIRNYESNISNQLQASISNKDDSLSLVYQPIMSTQDGSQIQDCEALLRWKDKEGKPIPAQEFITIAEKHSLIDDLNLYVIDAVCLQQKKWKQENKTKKKEIRVSINISGEAEIVITLLDRLLFHINRYDLKPSLFGIEITERTIFDMSDPILKKLTTLRDMGMKISLDDFGIGYSSLFYLRKIPLTTVKIDKVFIDEISFNELDNTIVKSVIDLSHSLGFTVVAEGVEHQDQLDLLKKHCCDYIQGYLYSKPVGNKEMLSMAC